MFGKNKIIGVYEAGQDLSDPSVEPALHLPSNELVAHVTNLGCVFSKRDIVDGNVRLRADVIESLLQSLTPPEPETAVEPQPATSRPQHTMPTTSLPSTQKQAQTPGSGARPSQPPTAVEARDNQVEPVPTLAPTQESLALSYSDLLDALSQLGLEEVLENAWTTNSNGSRVATVPPEAFEKLAELQAAKAQETLAATQPIAEPTPQPVQPTQQAPAPAQKPVLQPPLKPAPREVTQPASPTRDWGASLSAMADTAYDHATRASRALTPPPVHRFLAHKQREEADIAPKQKQQTTHAGFGPIETRLSDRIEPYRGPLIPKEVGRSVGLIVAAGVASLVLSSAAQEAREERTGSQGAQIASFFGGTVVNLYNTVSTPVSAVEQQLPFATK